MGANVGEIFGLIRAARAQRTARGAHLDLVGRIGVIRRSGALCRRLRRAGLDGLAAVHAEFLKRDVHTLGVHRLTRRARVQILQHRFRALGRGRHSDDLKSIAAPADFHSETRLDLMQVPVERPA
jgi:hypothetical protein